MIICDERKGTHICCEPKNHKGKHICGGCDAKWDSRKPTLDGKPIDVELSPKAKKELKAIKKKIGKAPTKIWSN